MKLHTIIKQQKTTWKAQEPVTVDCTVFQLGPFEHLM